jgi:phosphatidylglycerol:prolipoprotein diacylglycerol transferase
MLPILQIGPAAIPTSKLLLLLGFSLGLTLSEHFSRRRGRDPDPLTNMVLLAVTAGLVLARLAYASLHPALFQARPLDLISLDGRLLDPWAGIAGAGITVLVYGQRKGLRFWETLDRLTPFLALFSVFIGLAHIASGQAFGASSSFPWSIDLWGARRHPSQIYETVGAAVILILLWKRLGSAQEGGRLFLGFAALASALTVFLIGLRGDSRLILGGFRQEQLLALVVLGLALLLLEVRPRPGDQERLN